MPHALAYGAQSPTSPLAKLTIDRREPGPTDVKIDIVNCGVCHSDLHTARGEWAGTKYPSVPGHEIVGVVISVGADVKKFKAGDRVGVGVMVDSCRECDSCKEGLEQYCETGFTGTYNAPDKHTGGYTLGGYASEIVVDQDFVLSLADNLPFDAAAPLLCAGITLWSPLRHWNAGPGKKVAVVGLGGLGHMGVKLARALGAHVVVITTSPSKAAEAHKLGAHEVIISTNKDDMARHKRSLDLIVNTVSAVFDIDSYQSLLKRDGTQVLLGLPPAPLPPINVGRLVSARQAIAGSTIGGIRETQEMLDFCAKHDIVSEVEVIPMNQINEAYERMLKGDVKYRFVIDMASLKAEGAAA